jgi:hypothetical protein
VSDAQRAAGIAKGIVGKLLSYRSNSGSGRTRSMKPGCGDGSTVVPRSTIG